VRRGSVEAQIHFLSFDATTTFLTCCSDHAKIHVFKVQKGANVKSSFDVGWIPYYVPFAGSEWSVAQFLLTEDETKD
jgi:hypothetical protein